MVRVVFIVLFTAALLCTAAPVWAATFYTATSGLDSNSCAQATNPLTPKLTIYEGMKCLQTPGDILSIGAGIYHESHLIGPPTIANGTSTSPMTIKPTGACKSVTVMPEAGTPNNNVIFDFINSSWITIDCLIIDNNTQTSGVRFASNAGILIQGMTLSNSEVKNANVNAISCFPDTTDPVGRPGWCVFQGNLLHDSGLVGGGYGIYSNGQGGTIIDGNEIYHNGGYGIQLYEPNFFPMNFIVRNNKIHDNSAGTTGSSYPFGMQAFCQGCQIYNNIFYNHTINSDAAGLNLYNNTRNNQVYNNTFYNNTNGISFLSPAGGAAPNTIENNIIFTAAGVNFAADPGGQTYATNLCGLSGCNFTSTSDMEFVSTAIHDFHLLSGAMSRNNGSNLSASFTTDIANVMRPSPPTAWDIGAYQFTGNPPLNSIPIFMNAFRRNR